MSVSQMNGDYYPANLKFIANSLSGFSRMRSKLTLPFSTAKGGDLIFFKLPSNAMIDLSTLSFCCDVSTSATAGYAVLPQFSGCLVDQISVDFNGINVQTIPQYAHLNKILNQYQAGDMSCRGSFLEWVGNTNVAPAGATCQMNNVSVAIKNWLGILGSGKIIDCNVLGEITVSIRLIPNSALIATGTNISYTIGNMSVQFDTINLDNPVYHESLYRQLSNGGLKWAFQNYITNMGGSMSLPVSQTFSVSTQSLDYLIGTLLPSDYNGSGGNTHNSTTGTSYFFNHGVNPSDTNSSAQFSVGSILIPNYLPTVPEQLSYTLDSMGLTNDILGTSCDPLRAITATTAAPISQLPNAALTNAVQFANYNNGNYVFCARLCHGEKNPGAPLLSGLSTQGTNIMLNFRVNGSGSTKTYIPLVFAACTSLITIGQGRQINLTI